MSVDNHPTNNKKTTILYCICNFSCTDVLSIQILVTELLEKFSVKLLHGIFFPSLLISKGLHLHSSPGVHFQTLRKKREFSAQKHSPSCLARLAPWLRQAICVPSLGKPHPWRGQETELSWAETSAPALHWGRYNWFKWRRGATLSCRQAQLWIQSLTAAAAAGGRHISQIFLYKGINSRDSDWWHNSQNKWWAFKVFAKYPQ